MNMLRRRAIVAAATAGMAASAAQAFEIETEPPLQIRWDNTIKYSAARRMSGSSPALLANINGDDGNRNFDTGLISNRLDLLSELDVTYKRMGLRISGAAWYDARYNRPNANNSPATANAISVPANEFTDATRDLHGRRAEILDAFVFGSTRVRDMPVTVRAGRHTLLWGESLLLAANGIAYGQAPIDAIKAQAVPGTQAKELFMPVGQVSGQLQPSAALSLAGYVQYDWRKSRLPAAGSYFSASDLLDAGGERQLPVTQAGPALLRGNDLNAGDSGQWGLSARYRAESIDTEFGVYYLQFNDKSPQRYQRPAAGDYVLVYPEDIRVIGASFSTVAGNSNVAGEIHVRRNTPLVSGPLVVPAGVPADNDDHPLYAVGNTVHAQVSVVSPLSRSAFWDGGTVLAEVGALYRTDITKNGQNADPSRDRGAWGWSLTFTPSYLQVLPELDLNVPVSLSYAPKGKSPVAGALGSHKAGVFSIGLGGEYKKTWTGNLRYTAYFGGAATQTLTDRNFISLSIQRTF